MSSTYSALLQLELMADGEKNNTWGDVANVTFNLIEAAIAGVASISLTNTNYTLSVNNGSSDEARCSTLVLSGTLTGNVAVIIPNKTKKYTIVNATTGAYTVTAQTASPTLSTVVPQGAITDILVDGANNVKPIAPIALNGALNAAGNVIADVILFQLFETCYVAGNVTGAVALDFANGNHMTMTLTGNVTLSTIANPPPAGILGYIRIEATQNGTGGYTVTHPAAVSWPSNLAPVMTAGAGKKDIWVYTTTDGGVTYNGAVYGQAY